MLCKSMKNEKLKIKNGGMLLSQKLFTHQSIAVQYEPPLLPTTSYFLLQDKDFL